MTVRPIIFSAPMVRALLAGSKTMTRRALKPQPVRNDAGLWTLDLGRRGFSQTDDVPATMHERGWLRFAVGDLLWVRETWKPHSIYDAMSPRHVPQSRVFYAADEGYAPTCRWHPGIHMPRWASRLTLAVTAVKVERLQDISEADSIAEGIEKDHAVGMPDVWGWHDYLRGNSFAKRHFANPRDSFCSLWNSINGSAAWDANPWVVALTFSVHRTNVDNLPTAEPA